MRLYQVKQTYAQMQFISYNLIYYMQRINWEYSRGKKL